MTEKSVFLEDDVTIIPNLLFLVSRFCIPPEVKFHNFGTLKQGAEKSLSKVSFAIYTYQYIAEILLGK